jgi:hypothetical protein
MGGGAANGPQQTIPMGSPGQQGGLGGFQPQGGGMGGMGGGGGMFMQMLPGLLQSMQGGGMSPMFGSAMQMGMNRMMGGMGGGPKDMSRPPPSGPYATAGDPGQRMSPPMGGMPPQYGAWGGGPPMGGMGGMMSGGDPRPGGGMVNTQPFFGGGGNPINTTPFNGGPGVPYIPPPTPIQRNPNGSVGGPGGPPGIQPVRPTPPQMSAGDPAPRGPMNRPGGPVNATGVQEIQHLQQLIQNPDQSSPFAVYLAKRKLREMTGG